MARVLTEIQGIRATSIGFSPSKKRQITVVFFFFLPGDDEMTRATTGIQEIIAPPLDSLRKRQKLGFCTIQWNEVPSIEQFS